MHEPYRSPAHEPGAADRAYPPGQHETRAFETRPFDDRPFETRPFDDPPNHHLETQAFDPPHFEPAPDPQPRPARPYEPLAHEGGLPYGTPPAPPAYRPPSQQPPAYRPPPQQFVPQHLAMPQQFAPGPYGQGQFPQPYMYPPHPMQQTVYVHNGRRVNHGLHLILTLFTFGLWLPVWIILAIANS